MIDNDYNTDYLFEVQGDYKNSPEQGLSMMKEYVVAKSVFDALTLVVNSYPNRIMEIHSVTRLDKYTPLIVRS